MIFELVKDYAAVLDAMPAEHPKHRMLELLQEAIRRDVHFIARHPTTLFQWPSMIADDNSMACSSEGALRRAALPRIIVPGTELSRAITARQGGDDEYRPAIRPPTTGFAFAPAPLRQSVT